MLRFLALLLLVPLAASCATTPAGPAFASERIGVTVTGSGPEAMRSTGSSDRPSPIRSTRSSNMC